MSNEDTPRVDTGSGSLAGLGEAKGKMRPTLAALGLLVLLVAFAAWWFSRPGEPRSAAKPGAASAAAVGVADEPASTPDARSGRLSPGQLERMVAQSEARVTQNPRDASALAMLAHSQEMLGQFGEATKTYRKLADLMPRDAQVLADYADALGMANGRTLQGEPEALLERALVADPQNVKALMLAGSVAMERGDTQKALLHWRKAKAAVTQPELARQIATQIAAAGGEAPPPGSPLKPPNAAAGMAPTTKGEARVAGRVWLARELMGVVSPDAVVYIMVRPANEASRMPLALLRKRVKELPANFVLDDSNAMVKGVSLTEAQSVVVVARVSTRGDVSPKAGDLQGMSQPVPLGTADIKLEINEVLK